MKKLVLISFIFFSTLLWAQVPEATFKIKNLEMNTEYSDFGFSYYGDFGIYASSKPIKRKTGEERKRKGRKWKGNKQPFLELYKGVIQKDGELVASILFSEEINSKFHESSVSFTNDYNTVYFTRNNYFDKKYEKDSAGFVNLKMYRAYRDYEGAFTILEDFFAYDSAEYSVGHPSLNKAENKIYYISDMPGGYGGTDIYTSTISLDGTFGKPVNLGPKINTDGMEMFPFVDDNGVLYYAADSLPNCLGMMDIYYIKIADIGVKDPIHMNAPINSMGDDFAFVMNTSENNGYFSSNREGGKGDDDIYFFEMEMPRCEQIVNGSVKDKVSEKLIPGAKVSLFYKNKVKETTDVGNDAHYEFKVDCKSKYRIKAEKLRYKSDGKNFKTDNQNNVTTHIDLKLSKKIINIPTIYFDLDKHSIRDDAANELDKVVKIMKENPEIIVELSSHTDSRASDNYNQELSDSRAKSSIEYIINQGIHSDRIYGRGYGETQLTNECADGVNCTEAEHQRNRRTEFKIVPTKPPYGTKS